MTGRVDCSASRLMLLLSVKWLCERHVKNRHLWQWNSSQGQTRRDFKKSAAWKFFIDAYKNESACTFLGTYCLTVALLFLYFRLLIIICVQEIFLNGNFCLIWENKRQLFKQRLIKSSMVVNCTRHFTTQDYQKVFMLHKDASETPPTLLKL